MSSLKLFCARVPTHVWSGITFEESDNMTSLSREVCQTKTAKHTFGRGPSMTTLGG